jgi:hypothetical protein
LAVVATAAADAMSALKLKLPPAMVAACLQIITRLVRSAQHANEFVAANGPATVLALPSSAAFPRHT